MVAVIRSGSSRDERVTNLMRSLFLILAHYNMQLSAQHIAGVENRAADAVSSNDAAFFLTQVPFAKGDIPGAGARTADAGARTARLDVTELDKLVGSSF